jgi:hypothetical protein
MTLKEIFAKNSSLYGGPGQSYGIKSYSLPNDTGTYSAQGTSIPTGPLPGLGKTPIFPTPDGLAPVIPKPKPDNGGNTKTFTGGTPSAPSAPSLNYDKYKDPATGKILTPQEYANLMAKKAAGGAIPSYVGDSMVNPNQSIEELNRSAAALRGAQTDMATGAADPYGAATKSGIPYTAADLSAIEKAYAGIYDPAITDVFTKIDAKKEEVKSAMQLENDLKKMEQEHKYAMELKRTPTASESAASAGFDGGGAATYVKGANPIVDGWVDRLNISGQDINAAIPGVKNQGLRNAVMIGMNATKTQNAKNSGTLDDINTMSTMLANPQLENISGITDQFAGGLFGQAKTAKTQYNQIVGALQLAKAGQIKGQGQISDYERKVLKEASAAVDRGMNDEEFRAALVKLRGVLQTSSGMEAKVQITDPSTGQSDTQNLTTEEINGFIRDGAIIKYVE